MSVFAAHDQENLVHNLQTAAAGKPLNAGLKGFTAKTPRHKAPKTPFKIPLNDENAQFKGGKSVLQTKGNGNENLLMTGKKDGKLDKSAFVTPAGPRARAPLGMKTTNAKGQAFQTPAPLSASAKTQKVSPRLRRPKVKVHQPEAQTEVADDVPEIEYMPPKEVPLPENFDEDDPQIDWTFPMFKGENMMRGSWDVYHNPLEDDGRTRYERYDDEWMARTKKADEEEFDRKFNEMMAADDAECRRYLGIESPKKAAPKAELPKKKIAAPSTLKARSAAAALSPPAKPSYAAPTAAAKSKSLLPTKAATKSAVNPSASRHAAATAASKSTIGYAKGRPTATTARKPLSSITRATPTTAIGRPTASSSTHPRNPTTGCVVAKPRGAFSRSSSTATDATLVAPAQENQYYETAEDVENADRFRLLAEEAEEGLEEWEASFKTQLDADPLEDEYADFQLQLPEGF
ncbi:hypothetical protein BDV96DRAFT_503473 [Lophiotrema nucula]|uniref:Uncharacterized protein n=1 Tax=Lophiotrema nucula TaxID=690887 RepID=A0A6A5YPI7_9PLEO|nr:hypothetical protein BDV96DRAFT_503473 [Lophiotrema nucula]